MLPGDPDGFEVTCNHTFQPPRAFLAQESRGYPYQQNADGNYMSYEATVMLNNVWTQPVELVDFSLARGEARAYGAITTDCSTNETFHVFLCQGTIFSESPFISSARNVLTGVSWDMEAQLTLGPLRSSGYILYCGLRLPTDGPAIYRERVLLKNGLLRGERDGRSPRELCHLCAQEQQLVVAKSLLLRDGGPEELDHYGYETLSRKYPRGVPFVLDFAIGNASRPPAPAQPNYACRSANSFCVNATNSPDIDECELRKQYPELWDVYPLLQ
uniref:Wall-associated receptor kinase galacturonan-binding domain-containing protein n=1 Tax=Leersia perrieri TaxID=77586 RepID=A0A0D9XI60_9ORYZ